MRSGKRLSWYVRNAPPERVRKTIERLSAISTNRKLNSTVVHEASHAADDSDHDLSVLKQLRKASLVKKTIGYQALGLGVSQGTMFLLNTANVFNDERASSIVGISVAVGTATSMSIATILDFQQESRYKDKTEQKAYGLERDLEGSRKIITIIPKQ